MGGKGIDKVPRRRRKSVRGIFLDAEGPKIIGEKMNRGGAGEKREELE